MDIIENCSSCTNIANQDWLCKIFIAKELGLEKVVLYTYQLYEMPTKDIARGFVWAKMLLFIKLRVHASVMVKILYSKLKKETEKKIVKDSTYS